MVEDYHFDPSDCSIKNGKLAYAEDNVKHLLTDVNLKGVKYARDEASDDRGSFGFVIWKDNHACPIVMPGSPLHLTRHLPPDNRTPLNRPLDIGVYGGRFSWWNHLVDEIRDEMDGKGYNPFIEELEAKVEELEEKIEQLQER